MNPLLTSLSYSGGVQSNVLLEMVLRGDLQRPENFIVINADPGMEDERSENFVDRAQWRCKQAGIPFFTAPGPNLFKDLLNLKLSGKTRIDNPPFWTRNKVTGKIGRLKQTCTVAYKIEPMRRALRRYMFEKFFIPEKSKRIPLVESWIGFAADESSRIGKPRKKDPKYIRMAYPLIQMGMDRMKIEGYYLKHGIEKPPRSVCCACFANGLAYFEDMFYNRPNDWDKAVAVDEAVRDMSQVGILDEVFVSASCIPLKDLPALNFKREHEDYKEYRCNSGVCFV